MLVVPVVPVVLVVLVSVPFDMPRFIDFAIYWKCADALARKPGKRYDTMKMAMEAGKNLREAGKTFDELEIVYVNRCISMF